MSVTHENIKETLRSLADAGSARFEMDGVENDGMNFISTQVFYWCNIRKGMNLSSVAYGISVTRA